jgi:hypothetical protein
MKGLIEARSLALSLQVGLPTTFKLHRCDARHRWHERMPGAVFFKSRQQDRQPLTTVHGDHIVDQRDTDEIVTIQAYPQIPQISQMNH